MEGIVAVDADVVADERRQPRYVGIKVAANQKRMTELIQQSPAAPLLEMVGAGAVTVAAVLTAWSHPGRVRSEAAFAPLAGVNPCLPQAVTLSDTGLIGAVIDV
jgi:hypothetical protein